MFRKIIILLSLLISSIHIMSQKTVLIYIFDGYSDWEISFLAPELKKNSAINLLTVSNHGLPVISSGGFKITPDLSHQDIYTTNLSMLILPGGLLWEENYPDKIIIDSIVEKTYKSKKTIAAICGATIYLGRKGYLNEIKHTSNDRNYLAALAPGYVGSSHYQNELSINSDNIITANGTAPIEFARMVMEELGFGSDYVNKWFQLFKYGIWIE